jgi:hypothetical protein
MDRLVVNLIDGSVSTVQLTTEEVAKAQANTAALAAEKAAYVPLVVTMLQARKAMILSGVSIASVSSAIAAIADTQARELAQTEWEYSTTFRRDSELITSLAPALSLTATQINAMFVLAATL